MKNIITICVVVLMVASVFGQAPEKMSYQAVLRDASNNLIANTAVGMQISILQGSTTGTAVYVETQTPTTNDNGLISLEIGNGTVVTGDFTTIDWANDTHFVKTETDPTGGTTYSITGTNQLLSVPYALNAKTADNGITTAQANEITANTAKVGVTTDQATILGNTSGTNTGDQDGSETKVTAGTNVTVTGTGTTGSPYIINATDTDTQLDSTDIANLGYVAEKTYTIGLWPELGGYVFRISADGKHGLVAETQDQSTSNDWYTAQNIISNPANHSTNGQKFMDWRMPTKFELNEMYLQKAAIGGFAPLVYWSSTEFDNGNAWLQDFFNGDQISFDKNFTFYVCAVRAF